ncbi:MAG: metallophosphoesterase [Chromatiales bacterium]|nr:metallophosphoesterase [Chromatiales bacterium]
MKVAVFSDVQGNIAALEVVIADIEQWRPDLVIMNGDLVNRGPKNLECLKLFNEKAATSGWLPIKGNHEEYVLYCAKNSPQNPQEAALRRFADWTTEQLGDSVYTMQCWPDHLTLSDPSHNKWLHITHGTLAGNRDGISPSVPDEKLHGKLPDDIDLFITAHTHKALQRVFEGKRILNVGSVGSPFDGDPRASYARLTFNRSDWQAEIIRLAYDRQRMTQDCIESGFLDHAGPLARVIYREWEQATLLMPFWNRRYRQAVLDGDISLAEAVEQFLATH